MKEILLDVVAAGTFALSPHAPEHPAIHENALQTEVMSNDESLAATSLAQSEQSAAAPADSIPTLVETSHTTPDVPTDSNYNVAIAEYLDPASLTFWWEAGGLGIAGIGTVITRRQLKKNLQRSYETIKDEGWAAQRELKALLDDANLSASGSRKDDILKLRELIEKNTATEQALVDALGGIDAEFSTEHGRFLALKGRLEEAQHTSQVLKTTKAARKQIGELRSETERVKTAISEIGNRINHAEESVADVDSELERLVQDGWDIKAYKILSAALAFDVSIAKAKRSESYIDVPTEMAETITTEAMKLKEDAAALEPRRVAADEAWDAQPDRITEAEAMAKQTRLRLTKLQETYHEGCLAGFEDLEEKLVTRLADLTSTHDTGSAIVGEQGKSVEAVDRSEKLNESFDKTFKKLEAAHAKVQQRENHLANIARELPRQISELAVIFDRAKLLAANPDVEDTTAAKILSHDVDMIKLMANISTAEGRKPNYLDVESHYADVATVIKESYAAAAGQKQEMADLRADIPELIQGYNGMLESLKGFAGRDKVRLQPKTRQAINAFQQYVSEVAPDRKNLRKQQAKLTTLVRDVYRLTEQAQKQSEEDTPLVAGAKIVGGIALAIIGIDMLDS